jgi:ABC-type dipeptide/oligopeptide/nickel transport system permease subunit
MCIPWLLAWAFLPLDLIRRPDPRSPETTFARATVWIGLGLLATFALAALALPPLLDDPRAFDTTNSFARPSLAHPLGTTQLGQDIFSRVIAGIGGQFMFLTIPLIAGFLPAVVLGSLLARTVPSLRAALTETASAVLLLPILPFALVYVAGNDPGGRAAAITSTLFAAALGTLTALALASTSTSTWKDRIAIGATLASAACVVAFISVLTETTIAFLGFGAEMGTPNLGVDIAYGNSRASEFPHLLFGPAAVLCLFLFTFLLIRTALDDLDPPHTDEP